MIELYYSETCPYCQKVLEFFNSYKIDYVKHDINDYDVRQELVRLGGKEQVPFIIDNDKNIQMYESEDIIAYAGTYVK